MVQTDFKNTFKELLSLLPYKNIVHKRTCAFINKFYLTLNSTFLKNRMLTNEFSNNAALYI